MIRSQAVEQRAKVFDLVHQRSGHHLGGIVIKAEMGDGKKFPCTYYSGKNLAEGFLTSKILPTHLMPALGGITMFSLGSNELDVKALRERGDELVEDIWTRQAGRAVLLGTKPASPLL